jgi:hypothetical protein
MPRRPLPENWPGSPPPQGRRNQQLWEATRNLYNLVATDALDDHQVHQGLLQAVDRSGLLRDEPRQTQRTLTSSRQIAWPTPTQHPIAPAPTPPMLRHLHQPEPKASGPRIGASLKVATAKVERATERGSGDGAQARERAAERSGDHRPRQGSGDPALAGSSSGGAEPAREPEVQRRAVALGPRAYLSVSAGQGRTGQLRVDQGGRVGHRSGAIVLLLNALLFPVGKGSVSATRMG